jgi:hypothetical protein
MLLNYASRNLREGIKNISTYCYQTEPVITEPIAVDINHRKATNQHTHVFM